MALQTWCRQYGMYFQFRKVPNKELQFRECMFHHPWRERFRHNGRQRWFCAESLHYKQRLHNYCVSLSRQRSQCRFVLVLFNDIKWHERRNKNHADLCIRATRLGNPQSNSDGIRKNCAISSYSYLLAILQRNRKGREQDKQPIIRTD